MKGISLVERHFEKIILAVVAVSLLSWVAFDMLGFTSETIKMGGKEVALDQISKKLADNVNRLGKSSGAQADAVNPSPISDKCVKSFKEKIVAGPAGSDSLPAVAPPVANTLFKADQSGRQTWYYQPTFAAVTMQSPILQSEGAVAADLAKTDPKLLLALDARPGWSKGDRNVMWTTPAATINLKAIREEFAKADVSKSPAFEAIPASWRNNGIYLVDVVFERQQLQPDGSWGAVEIVKPIPGQASFRGQTITSPGKVFEEMRGAKNIQMKILQPQFFQLAQGNFADPAKHVAASGEPKEVTDKRALIEKKKLDLVKANEDLTKAGGEYTEPKDDKSKKGKGGKGSGGDTGGSVGGGGGPGGGGGGSGIGGRPPAAGESDPNSPKALRKRATLTIKRDGITAEISKIEKEIAAVLGTKPTESEAVANSEAPGVNIDDSIKVWGHDIGVKPGETYQYRCAIAVLNPFLGRSRQLVDAQKPLDKEFQILSAPSNWVRVTVNSLYAFYAIEANAPDGIGSLGNTQVQIFKLINGVWQSPQRPNPLEPGDPIGQKIKITTDEEANFDEGWFVVAVLEDLSAKSADPKNRPTLVVLAHRDGRSVVVRSPKFEQANELRRKLLDRVTNAKAAGSESSKTPAAGL